MFNSSESCCSLGNSTKHEVGVCVCVFCVCCVLCVCVVLCVCSVFCVYVLCVCALHGIVYVRERERKKERENKYLRNKESN